jgi:hypothetical protein
MLLLYFYKDFLSQILSSPFNHSELPKFKTTSPIVVAWVTQQQSHHHHHLSASLATLRKPKQQQRNQI